MQAMHFKKFNPHQDNVVKAVGDTYDQAIAKLTWLFNPPVNYQLKTRFTSASNSTECR
jgi:hypothetical protein